MVKSAEKDFHKDNSVKVTDVALALWEEACRLGRQLFGNDSGEDTRFANRLLDIYTGARDKDFLLIHNPGGWGNSPLEYCLHWERSIVAGISATLDRLGYTWLLSQHFRGGSGWREHIRDIKEQFRFFAFRRKILAAEVEFLIQHIKNLNVILIGVSHGAAFSNAVMQKLSGLHRVYSIELGVFFLQRSRRVVTEKTLAIDSNGLMPDAIMEGDLIAMLKTLPAAPFRWIKYRLEGKPVKFSHCINVSGHEYNWEYPEVRQQIGDFLEVNFGAKD